MTSNDSNIRASFRNLDGPVAVDPALAERLRAQMTEINPTPERAERANPPGGGTRVGRSRFGPGASASAKPGRMWSRRRHC